MSGVLIPSNLYQHIFSYNHALERGSVMFYHFMASYSPSIVTDI